MTALPDYAQALAAALASARALGQTEAVQIGRAAGRVLREPIVADRELPPFDRAQLDGYALRAAELGRVEAFGVVATIAAGRPADVEVPPGHCVAIATGAPLPAGVDTVIGHEQSDRGDPVHFAITSIERGHAVHRRGADAGRGAELVAAGTVLAARHLGLAAAVGLVTLPVARRPRATVLSSGDEVLPAGSSVATHQIRNSNGPMVGQVLRDVGAEPVAIEHVPDDAAATREAIGAALPTSDLLVTIGGVSAGDRDHVAGALGAHDVAVSLRGAAIQPGRPILVGRDAGGAVVVGLPGNPVSALACACLFVWPIVRAQLGLDPALPWRDVALAEPVTPNRTRRAFRPARLAGFDRAAVPPWCGSGDLAHTATTDGLLELPPGTEPIEAGTRLRFLAWP